MRDSLGKWGDPTVPKRGWEIVDVEDTKPEDIPAKEWQPDHVCQMCEKQPIRYAFLMEHEDYDYALMCGCVCAGYMVEDPGEAQNLQYLTGLNVKLKWKRTAKGNYRAKCDGHLCLVVDRGSYYTCAILIDGEWNWGYMKHDTLRSAQLRVLYVARRLEEYLD